MSKERYWEAGEAPEVLLDWVNENVVNAIKLFWEDEGPIGWADVKKGKMTVTFCGPGKPTAKDPGGHRAVYSSDLDLLKELRGYCDPYDGESWSDEQRKDVVERAAVLRKLAKDIERLADRVLKQESKKDK